MNDVKVSILVPAYQVELYLEDCLKSLLSQTLEKVEIIVVDDGSTDLTAEIADRYVHSDSRVRVFRQPYHQGVSAARNVCLSLAQGTYITFVDSDDTLAAGAVEKLYRKAVLCNADIVLGSILYVYENNTTVRVGDRTSAFPDETETVTGKVCLHRMQETHSYVPMVCGNLYRTAFLHAHAFRFEEDYHEDEAFTPPVLYYALRVTCLHGDFYYYRQRQGSIMHDKRNFRQRAISLCRIGEKLQCFAREVEYRISSIIRPIVCIGRGKSYMKPTFTDLRRNVCSFFPKKALELATVLALTSVTSALALTFGSGMFISSNFIVRAMKRLLLFVMALPAIVFRHCRKGLFVLRPFTKRNTPKVYSTSLRQRLRQTGVCIVILISSDKVDWHCCSRNGYLRLSSLRCIT